MNMNKQHSNSPSISKKLILEVCLISARGLPRHRLLKHQYYAIGWINEDDKYCTSIDASGNPNPVWNTKFSSTVSIDSDHCRDVSLNLNVQVYSREPVFLREKLVGTASVNLREFLRKYGTSFEACNVVNQDDVGSFQLRKAKSGEPQGFIDVSVKVSEATDATASCSFLGDAEGFNLQDNSGISLTATDPTIPPFHMSANHHPSSANPYTHPIPYLKNYWQPSSTAMPGYPPATVPNYPRPASTPPPPPPPPPPAMPPYAGGYAPSYINMPSSSGAGRGVGPGFGVGLGVGGLAAGAVMYGGDFTSGFELPTVMPNPSMTIAIDPPF